MSFRSIFGPDKNATTPTIPWIKKKNNPMSDINPAESLLTPTITSKKVMDPSRTPIPPREIGIIDSTDEIANMTKKILNPSVSPIARELI